MAHEIVRIVLEHTVFGIHRRENILIESCQMQVPVGLLFRFAFDGT